MNKTKGLFHVINEKTEDILGTAFAVKQPNSTNYYVITSYHVVAESLACGYQIIIRDENKICHSVRIISSQINTDEYCHPGKDYAVFELITNIQYDSFFIGKTENSLQQCYIRGAGIHFRTDFTRISAMVLGTEKEDGIKILNIQMAVYSSDNGNQLIRDQDVLSGMSGSPIVVNSGDREECVGVLGNVGSDRNGFIRYAVPISTILSDSCFLVSDPIVIQQNQYNDIDIKINYLFGDDPNDFLFYDETMDQSMWKRLSNWFYRGIPIDDELCRILDSEEIKTYSGEVRMALYYYYSRLLYKRGQIESGRIALNKSLSLEKKVSQKSKEKLNALANGRLLIENNKFFRNAEQVRYAGFNITKIPDASDSYIAYETASLYGKGMINLFSIKDEFSSNEKEDIKKIYKEQLRLYDNHKIVLARQDVVITSVEWYIGLWGIDSSITDTFESLVRKGFNQSKIRKNDIFHIQSLIAYGIYLLQTGQVSCAMIILTLCAMLMRSLRIFKGHEGIAQLLRFLRLNYSKEYAALHIVYSSSTQSETISKLDIMNSEFAFASWKFIIEYAIELFQDLYAHFLCENKKTIYNVKINDIETRLLF